MDVMPLVAAALAPFVDFFESHPDVRKSKDNLTYS